MLSTPSIVKGAALSLAMLAAGALVAASPAATPGPQKVKAAVRKAGKVQAPQCASCHASEADEFGASHHAKSWDRQGTDACKVCHQNPHSGEKPSALGKRGVVETCGQCHADEAEAFKASVHGQALAKGVREAPSCLTCHPAHGFKGPSDPSAAVGHANLPATCSQCHGNAALSVKFGLNPNVASTYKQGYHGVAVQAGVLTAANCASCHTAHNILAPEDPKSSVNPYNLPATCGQCHPGAGLGVAMGKVHVSARGGGGVIDYVKLFYIFMIIATLGAMLLHDLGDFIYKHTRAARPAPAASEGERMSLNERLQHAVLMLAFFVLAYTGFAHTFPQAWWAAPFNGGAGPGLRRIIHLSAAGVLVALALYHLGYLALTARGRQLVRELMVGLGDARDALRTVGAWFKLCQPPAHARRFHYPEKAEYWAMVWGTTVMTLTGLVMATRDFWLAYAPKWFIDIALTVHYWEAILAALSIPVWHFYWVFLDRYVFPMNWSWLTGYMVREPKPEAEQPAPAEPAPIEPDLAEPAPAAKAPDGEQESKSEEEK
jgi:cytochrome b subunit of formate dehydrogenase